MSIYEYFDYTKKISSSALFKGTKKNREMTAVKVVVPTVLDTPAVIFTYLE